VRHYGGIVKYKKIVYFRDRLIYERCNMAYKVGDSCVNCGSCDSECPVDAISEKEGKRWIDPAKCQSCGACAGVCPVEAISEE
jgi:ferredoxin